MRAASRGGAVEVSGLIEDYSSPRLVSIARLTENVQDALCPGAAGFGQLIDCAAILEALAAAPREGRAIKISSLIKDEVCIFRRRPIRPSHKSVEHGFRPGREKMAGDVLRRVKIEDSSAPQTHTSHSSSLSGRTEESAVRTGD